MGYFYSLKNYLKTDKGRHDSLDYLRALLIMFAVMAIIRIAAGILFNDLF